MKRRHFWGAVLVLCAMLTVFGSRAQAGDVLKVVPSSALGVVVINNVGQTDGKIQELAGQLQLPQLGLLTKLKADLGIQKGIDDAGCFALAAIPAGEGTAPVAVAYVPVDDYQEFIQQLNAEAPVDGISNIVADGKPSVVAECGDFAVITERENQAVLASVLSLTENIADETPSLDDWRADTQAYAVATPVGVKFAQQQVLTGLAIAKEQMGRSGVQGQQAMVGIEMYENLFKSLDQEINYTAVGLRIEDSGDVHFVGRTLLVDGGVIAGMAADAKPGQAGVLTGLPQMPFVFAGGGVMSVEAVEPMMKASFSMMKMYPGGESMTEEQFREIVAMSVQSMQGVRSMGMVLGVGEADEPLYSSMYLVVKTDDAEQYMKEYLGTIRKMAEIFRGSEFPFSYEVEPMQIEGRQGIQLSMGMAGMFGQQEVPGAEKIMELMFGEGDTMNVYMAVADKNTVLGSYVSKQNLVEALTSFDRGDKKLSDMPAVASTVASLDQDAQFIGLWSPQGTFAFASRLASAIDPRAAASIPQLGETSAVGFSVKLSPVGLDTETVIPADVLKTIAGLVRQIMTQRQQTPPGAL